MSREPLRSRHTLATLAVLGSVTVAAPLAAQCEGPIDLGRSAVPLDVPAGYRDSRPTPLVVLLHGYGGSGEIHEDYFRLGRLVDELGFLYTRPDGTVDLDGYRFWNATDACCNFFNSEVDDSAYIEALIDEIRARCNVDRRRIYLIGHSNGGFMAYRMACDHASRVSGIASLAGATYFEPTDCAAREPVHVLQIHGTRDNSILYGGGTIQDVPYPGARETVALWAGYNACAPEPEPAGHRNLVLIPGAETSVSRHPQCAAGGSAELWTANLAGHVPGLLSSFASQVLEHLLARPKCRGTERVKRTACNARGRLTVKLAGAVSGEGYRVELPGGEAAEGTASAGGRAKVRFLGQSGTSGRIAVSWGCGALSTAGYRCP